MTPVFEKVAADDSAMAEIAAAFETGALVLSRPVLSSSRSSRKAQIR
jgi:hypothetical protein